MMNSLYTAQSGLSTSKYAVDVTSNNIANENTEGYKKRVVLTSEISLDNSNNVGSGVSFDGVNRTTSSYLFEQILNQNSQSSYYKQKDSTLSNIEMLFNETNDSGFSTTLSEFFNSIENLRSDPSSSIYESNLETQGSLVVSYLQDLYGELEDAQSDIYSSLNEQVDTVNNLLEQIVELNEKLVQNPQSNDLLDKRDALEKELSQYVDIEVDLESSNYNLFIGGQTVIFNNTNLHEISVDEEYISQKDIYTTTDLDDGSLSDGDTIELTLNNTTTITISASVSGAADDELKNQIVDEINNNPEFTSLEAYLDTSGNLVITSKEGGEDNRFSLDISVNGTAVSKSVNSVEGEDIVNLTVYNNELELRGGSAKSLIENLTTSTSNISTYKQALNDFANALSETMNENSSVNLFSGSSVNTLVFNRDNVSYLSSNDLESLAQIQWSEDINIDSSSSDTTSFRQFYQDFLVSISSDVESNSFLQDVQDSVLNSLEATYDEITKVDTDEEMVNLLQYQAAYQANAKVITAVDEMLQTILNM